MEDGISQGADLVATVIAGVAFAVSDAVITRLNDATLRAGRKVAVGKIEHVIQTGVIVWEVQMERIDGIAFNPHTTSVSNLFLDVKG